MKILLLADQPEPTLWEHLDRRKLEGVELVLSCGDLPAGYLSFLTCFTNAPILYIRGNHDDRYAQTPPEGCDCIEDKVVEFRGLRIAGLGGSRQYRPGPYQYSEEKMQRRIRHMSWKLRKGVDIVITHAPVAGFGDLDDLPHRGFASFRTLIDKYSPQFLLHGHVHADYGHGLRREYEYGGTRIINVGDTYILEIPDDALPQRRKSK